MNRSRRMLLTTCCLLALLASGVGALAQKQTPEKASPPPPDGGVSTRTNVILTALPPDGQMPIHVEPNETGGMAAFTLISPEMNFESAPVKGAPYSAEAINESVQTLADGNRIVRKSTTLVYRDSEGRTRREQNLNNIGPFATAGDAPIMITITDPVAGTSYALDPRTHIARTLKNFAFSYGPVERTKILPAPGEAANAPAAGDAPLTLPPGGLRGAAIKRVEPVYPDVAKAAGAQGSVTVQVVIDEQGNVASARAVSGHPLLQQAAIDAARQWVFKPTIVGGRAAKVNGLISFNFMLDKNDLASAVQAAERMPKPVKESLGTQNIEGVEATGTRITTTLSAGAIGNEQPINIVTETWYSPELHAVIMSKHTDPRFGETTYRLTNINRSEPAHSLFEVPADYTIKTDEPMRREFRMVQPENNQ
jgi:TonB family protein